MVRDDGNRAERRARRSDGILDTEGFLKLADRFIDLANRENRKVPATELHTAFLFAAARYNAHVAKTVMNVEDHEKFVAHMSTQYADMLRQHLADETISDEG